MFGLIGKDEPAQAVRLFYHSALNHMEEFLDIWGNEDPWMETMSWTNNTRKRVVYLA